MHRMYILVAIIVDSSIVLYSCNKLRYLTMNNVVKFYYVFTSSLSIRLFGSDVLVSEHLWTFAISMEGAAYGGHHGEPCRVTLAVSGRERTNPCLHK